MSLIIAAATRSTRQCELESITRQLILLNLGLTSLILRNQPRVV